VALSLVEAKYMEVNTSSCEDIWFHKFLAIFLDQELDPTIIYCDNQNCIKFSENTMFHDRSKHIEMIYHFICDMDHNGGVKLQYIPTDQQVADIMTKPLAKWKLEASEIDLDWCIIPSSLRGSLENYNSNMNFRTGSM
jgi:hypothetical protein